MQLSQLNANENPDIDNPALSKVIERKICTIFHLRTKNAKERSPQSQIADAITSFSGRMVFVYGHITWKPSRKMYCLRSIACKQSSRAKDKVL